MGSFQEGVVAVITMDSIQKIAVATRIRSAGIPCETYLTGNIKKQMKKASDLEAVVLILEDGIYIKDMLSGNQRPVEGDIVEAVKFVLWEGYYDDDILQDS